MRLVMAAKATESLVAFQSESPSSSRCCCCQHHYFADVDAAYRDMDTSDKDGDVEDVDFSVILNNYEGFETGLGRRTATAIEHVRMVCGQEDGKNNGGGWRE
ncbi:hypothetical protein RHSIM_Rhsim01G0184100 [Rhododendron simsii]|uniref:Uncharacterized protein n=1 Tax=Rhododendron simsii TaxID=118357 RepID=A0A834HHC3_RHOSS|nr:hypothetical protein RHSIM_Rhsim01G0184100 [Rhododendron simsii]